jgi:hypothetical protein
MSFLAQRLPGTIVASFLCDANFIRPSRSSRDCAAGRRRCRAARRRDRRGSATAR